MHDRFPRLRSRSPKPSPAILLAVPPPARKRRKKKPSSPISSAQDIKTAIITFYFSNLAPACISRILFSLPFNILKSSLGKSGRSSQPATFPICQKSDPFPKSRHLPPSHPHLTPPFCSATTGPQFSPNWSVRLFPNHYSKCQDSFPLLSSLGPFPCVQLSRIRYPAIGSWKLMPRLGATDQCTLVVLMRS